MRTPAWQDNDRSIDYSLTVVHSDNEFEAVQCVHTGVERLRRCLLGEEMRKLNKVFRLHNVSFYKVLIVHILCSI